MKFASFIGRFQRIKWLQPSVIALVAANMVPLVAVFVFHWDVFSLVFLFWLENVIVGVVNILKMLLAGVGAKDLPRYGWLVFGGVKLFLIPFFCVHYGLFTFVHGILVVGIFDKGALHHFGGLSFQFIFQIIRDNHLEWPFAALVVSHLISFGWDYLWSGAFRHTNPMELMTQPYRRVMVMHVSVIIGAFLTEALRAPEAALIFLVALKTGTDLWGHQGEREKFAANNDAAPVTVSAASPPSVQNLLQLAMQARAQQTGQAAPADKKQFAIIIGVVLVFLILFLGFLGFFAYEFVSPFMGKSRAMAIKPPAANASWTLDLKNAQFPDAPAAGKFRGDKFRLEHAVFANGTLSLRQGGRTNSRTFVISLPLRPGEILSGHSFHFFTDTASAAPEIKLAWHEDGSKKARTQAFTNGYALKLDFFWPAHGKTPGMIYLCLPDSDKSYLAGSIEAVTRKPKSSQTPDDN